MHDKFNFKYNALAIVADSCCYKNSTRSKKRDPNLTISGWGNALK